MAKVKLSSRLGEYYALVDDDDFEFINRWKWKYSLGYAVRSTYNSKLKKYQNVYMHRVINNTPQGEITDHLNRNKLDNRKANLITADKSVNSINRDKRPDNSSGYVGVYLYYPKIYRDRGWAKLWGARVERLGKIKYLGYFKSAKLASDAREKYLSGLNQSS